MSGFFGDGQIPGGVVLGNLLGKGGFFGPIFAPAGGHVLNLSVGQDFIGADGNTGTGTPANPGLTLTQLMSAQQAANFEAGMYTTVNISGSGAPARGYWIISGGGTPPAGALGGAAISGGDGFIIDDSSPNAVTFNFDLSLIRLYGGGGCGADELRGAGNGGQALNISTNNGADVNVNVSIVSGLQSGRLFGGGGGGGSTGIFGSGGGGGAAGLRPGGNSAEGGTSGGVYDPVNGGVSNPNVTGGAGTGGGGNGGGLGADGLVGSLGTGGAAVARGAGITGVTTITSGNDANHVRGAVQ